MWKGRIVLSPAAAAPRSGNTLVEITAAIPTAAVLKSARRLLSMVFSELYGIGIGPLPGFRRSEPAEQGSPSSGSATWLGSWSIARQGLLDAVSSCVMPGRVKEDKLSISVPCPLTRAD